MKKTFARILSIVLLAAMLIGLVSMIPVAKAESDPVLIDTTEKGTINVYKFANFSNSLDPTAPGGSGMSGQTAPTGNVPLAGVKFFLYKLTSKPQDVVDYYNGTANKTYTIPTDYSSLTPCDVQTTSDTYGLATFSNLEVGIYVLREADPEKGETFPEQIVAPRMKDTLISIPMVNSSTGENVKPWLYAVTVYPKNHEARGNVILTKTGNGEKLENVEFELYKNSGTADNPTWDKVEGYYTDGNATTQEKYQLKTNEEGKLEILNLPADYDKAMQYKLVEVKAPNGYVVNSTPILFKVNTDSSVVFENPDANTSVRTNSLTQTNNPNDTLNLTLENPKPSMVKKIHKSANNTGSEEWVDDDSFEMSDVLKYQMTIDVPFNVSEMDLFQVVDTPVGIKVKESTVQATVSGVELTRGTDYTVTQAEGANGFTLTLTDGLTGGKQKLTKYMNEQTTKLNTVKMVITYEADFLGNATTVNGAGNHNTATLTYCKDVNTDEHYTIYDETHAYTYDFNITKTLENSEIKPNDVKFKLYRDKAGNNEVKVVRVTPNVEGAYRLAVASDSTTDIVDEMVTKDGLITINGLEGGDKATDNKTSYWLKETATHANYNLLSELFEIKVTTTETTSYKNTTSQTENKTECDEHKVNKAEDQKVEIINRQGYVLPQTGSMGYLLFCAAGLLLIGGGAAIIFGDRKKVIR